MKLRRLSHTLIGFVAVVSSIVPVLAQTPLPPVAGNPQMPPPPPQSVPSPSPPQPNTPPQMQRFPQMPPAPPPVAPINLNSPGIEANVPAVINIPGDAAAVNGKPITYDYLIKKFLQAGAPKFLDDMINEALIRQEATKEGVVVTPAETNAKILQAKTTILPQYPGMSWAQFLAYQGLSESYVKDQIYDGLIAIKLIEKRMPDSSLVGKVHLFHILRLTQPVPNGPAPASDAEAKAEIEQIAADIQSGKMTFQEEAARESQDSSASKGGDLGWVGPDARLDPTFAAAAFKLKEGEISGPVRSQYGWHLIYAQRYGIHATAADIAEYQATFDDRARQQIQPYLKQLRAQAKIVNYLLPLPTAVVAPKSPMIRGSVPLKAKTIKKAK